MSSKRSGVVPETPSAEFDVAERELYNLIANMRGAAENYQLMSLVAAQTIGAQLPVCIVYDGPEWRGWRRSDRYRPFIQPSWQPTIGAKREKMLERCAFLADQYETSVCRWSSIDVTHRRRLGGEQVTEMLTGRSAQALQHAVEHLSHRVSNRGGLELILAGEKKPPAARINITNNHGLDLGHNHDCGYDLDGEEDQGNGQTTQFSNLVGNSLCEFVRSLSDPALMEMFNGPTFAWSTAKLLTVNEPCQITITIFLPRPPFVGLAICDQIVDHCRPIVQNFYRRIGVRRVISLGCHVHDLGAGWAVKELSRRLNRIT